MIEIELAMPRPGGPEAVRAESATVGDWEDEDFDPSLPPAGVDVRLLCDLLRELGRETACVKT